MNPEAQKVRAEHLKRDAYLYVRQSTLRQVFENTESTQRQYALRDRAVALGWPNDRIIVIDSDLGQSGADSDRQGFQRLVADVGMARAGIVLGLEVSRLARNCSDWHQLLEICALTGTLILDEDGLYDPQHFNDRLLLGLKGTMSEAELHLLRARLRGGILNKARRGELQLPLPVGFVHVDEGRIVLDPDRQVRQAVTALFDTFRTTGSALAVVKRFHQQGWLFPRRTRGGHAVGELLWGSLGSSQVLRILHNPCYAGAYVFGRHRTGPTRHGTIRIQRLPQEQWAVLLLDSFAGYISWEEYQDNQRRLRDNARAYGAERRHGPVGTGCALLQGMVLCGRCGRRMTVRYYHRFGRIVPWYVCQKEGIEKAGPFCQSVPGQDIDAAVGKLLLEKLTPAAVEVAVAVQQEIRVRAEQADALRRQQVERARYEAELARRRYVRVAPENRLVADTLEADWNDKLRTLRQAEEQYQKQRQQEYLHLDEQLQEDLRALTTDVARLWNDAKTSSQDRKRIVRLLIEDATILRKDEGLATHLRWKGGMTETIQLGSPQTAWELRQTKPEVVQRIDALLECLTDRGVAERLNVEGWKTGMGQRFTPIVVQRLRKVYGLRSRFDRLRALGYQTLDEMSAELGVTKQTIKIWRHHGLLRAQAYSDKEEYLYEPLGENRPKKQQGQKLSERQRVEEINPNPSHEV